MKVIKFVFSFLHDLRLTFIVYCLLSLITGGIAIYTPIINEKFIDILTGTIQGSYTSYIVQFCAISIINLGITYFIKVLSVKLKKSVYIWDEPDTALDEAAKQALIKILKELSNEAIVVIITHNSDLLNACETIYHL